jgi:protein-S-isoprenylcysteine O-methyltransferase Ste14
MLPTDAPPIMRVALHPKSTDAPHYDRRQRLFALGLGVANHALFAAAVGSMIWGLRSGMRSGFGPFRGAAAVVANGVLVLHFPLLHSYLLSPAGRARVARRVPFRLGRDLATTTYAMGASLQLLVVFGLWSPSGTLWWEPAGALGGVFDLAFATSWLLLAKAMADAGLGIQSGSQGWLAVARGLRPRYGPFPQHGLFRWCRQPVYLAFALTLWTGAAWTPDHLVIAAVWTTYCVLGARIKERRYLAAFGDEFRAYQRRVGFWWPAASAEPPRG